MSTFTGAPAVAVPVAKSVFSADALARVVEEMYGLEEASCHLLESIMLDAYEVRARQGRFNLRVYPAGRVTPEMVLGELDFLTRLDEAGVAVTAPVVRRDGERLLALEAPEGVRQAALVTAAPGQELYEKLKPDNIRAYAAALARLHDVADAMPPIPSRPALTVETLVDEPLEALERTSGTRSSAGYMGRYTAELVRPVIAALPMEAPVYGLSHGNAGTSHAMITSEGRITLQDFDMCGPAWRAYDVAMALNEIPEGDGKHFLNAYQDTRPLSPDELAAIPHFQAAQLLWIVGTRARFLNEWSEFVFPEPRVIQTFGRIEALVSKLKKGRTAMAL